MAVSKESLSKEYEEQVFMALKNSECIASDDPRLKSN